MKWTEALSKIRKPVITNREAAGLIKFGRAVFAKFGRSPTLAIKPFDWYAFALPALGWFHEGDRFKVDAHQQDGTYPTALELWEQLNGLATDLDAQGVAFSLLTNPQATAATFRAMALEAWRTMLHERAEQPGGPSDPMPDGPPLPPSPSSPSSPPSSPPTPPSSPPSSGSSGGGVLLLLLLFAFASGGRRRR
jgi:hypothetical protein